MNNPSNPPRTSPPPRPGNQFARSAFDLPSAPGGTGSLASLDALIAAEDLSVVFQPIVHMESFRVFAYEALTRCRVPALSNPMKLFERAVAEGCVGRLGRMVREIAVPLCAGRPVFLNLHPEELTARWVVRPDDPMFLHDHDVYLEITESAPITHYEQCRDVLRELRSRGNVHLVVDDLGAGYSNLKRIADLEPRVVKLDRELITGLTRGSRNHRLVAGVVRLCEDLGAQVVAEGIETVAEWDALRDTGVHYAQGFLFARPGFPLPAVSVPAALELASARRATSAMRAPTPAHGLDKRTPLMMRAPTAPAAVTMRDTRTPVHQLIEVPAIRGRDTRTPLEMRAPALPERKR